MGRDISSYPVNNKMKTLFVGVLILGGCVWTEPLPEDFGEKGMIMQGGYPLYPRMPLGVVSYDGATQEAQEFAISFWNTVAGAEVFYLDLDGTVGIRREQITQGYLGLASIDLVGTEIVGCQITLSVPNPRPTWVLTHEMGHCLGLDDDVGTPYLMHSSGYHELSPTDISLVREIADLQKEE